MCHLLVGPSNTGPGPSCPLPLLWADSLGRDLAATSDALKALERDVNTKAETAAQPPCQPFHLVVAGKAETSLSETRVSGASLLQQLCPDLMRSSTVREDLPEALTLVLDTQG